MSIFKKNSKLEVEELTEGTERTDTDRDHRKSVVLLQLLYPIFLSDNLTPLYSIFLLPSVLLFEKFHFDG